MHHLFVILGILTRVPTNAHPKSLDYFLRAFDATELIDPRTLAVYVKLPRALFYAPIIPAPQAGATGHVFTPDLEDSFRHSKGPPCEDLKNSCAIVLRRVSVIG